MWARLDRKIGEAVRGELPPTQKHLMDALLVGSAAAGLGLSWLYPHSAVTCLIWPLLLGSFFRGVRRGIVAAPLFVLAFALVTPGGLPDVLGFLALSLFSVFIAGVTCAKYRLVYLQEQALTEQLRMAREVQRALEPPSYFLAGPVAVSTRIQVCQWLGGDAVAWHAWEDAFCLVLLDVLGKGVQAAVTAARLKGAFDEFCHRLPKAPPPSAVLTMLETHLRHPHPSLVSALVVVVDKRTWKIAGAGHPPPIMLRPQVEPELIWSGGTLLGVNMAPEEELCFPARSGDRLVLCSDGVWEEETLSALQSTQLSCLAPTNLEECCQRAVGILGRAREGKDDETTVIIEVRP